MWRFVNFDPQSFGDKPKQRLADIARFHDVTSPETLTDELRRGAEGIVVRLGTALDAALLRQFDRLKMIATVTTGLDHIDLDYCARHDVEVLSLQGETEFLETIRATPELTWALLLGLLRKLPHAHAAAIEGGWQRERFFGRELYGKRLGIVGFGRIGRILGGYAHAFGMEVCAYDRVRRSMHGYPFRWLDLDMLLRTSDIVSVHLPLTQETHRFIDREKLQRMHCEAYLINTARGAIVDETALIEALEQRWIAGAAVDVIEGETIKGCVSAAHPLVQYARAHDNLLISPHIGGSTYESMERTAIFMADKIRRRIA